MYEIKGWMWDNENNKLLRGYIHSINIDGGLNRGLHGFAYSNDMYMLALALHILNFDDNDYLYVLADSDGGTYTVHNIITYGTVINVAYQNNRGQEVERYIEVMKSHGYREVYKVRYTRNGKKIKEWIGTIGKVV